MRRLALVLAVCLTARAAAGQTVSELFQKGKEQVKAGAWKEALSTFATVDTEAAKPANEGFRKQLEGPLAFYRGVCEANLDQEVKAHKDFRTFLLEQPHASIDEKTYSKKVVAAFEQAQKGIATYGPWLMRAYESFQPPAKTAEPADGKWGEGPVRWLMSESESDAWSRLTTDSERAAFVETFWLARDSGDDHSFRPTFEKRVAFADANLTQDDRSKTRGSMTDRGMVFSLLGPPTAASRLAPSAAIANPGTSYLESWHYRKELLPKGVSYQELYVGFWTQWSYGSNVLRRDADVLATLSAAKKKPELRIAPAPPEPPSPHRRSQRA